MAAKVTIDWDNKLFIAKAGITEIDVAVDLYSDWKEDVKPTADNQLGAPIAMRVVGGDPTSPTTNLGGTFFFVNGWKLRPDEADHTLTLNGNLFADPSDEPIIVPTLGAFTVLVKQVVSNLIDQTVSEILPSDITRILQILDNEIVTNPITGDLELKEGGVVIRKWPLSSANGVTPYDGTFSPDRRGEGVDVP